MNELLPVPQLQTVDPRTRSSAYPAYTARDFLTVAFYYRWVMAVAFLVPFLLGLAAAVRSHTMYVAQARLLVLYGSEYVFHPAVGQAGSGIALDRNQIMLGEQQILESTTLATETLHQVGLETVYPGSKPDLPNATELAALQFERDLTVTAVPQANVIELSFQNRNPEVAAATLRILIDRYMDLRSTLFRQSSPPGPGASHTQADPREQYAERLRQADDALARFGEAHGITNLDEQITLLLHQVASMVDQQNQTEQAIQETTAKLDVLRGRVASVPMNIQVFADTARSQQTQALTETLLKLEQQRRDLVARYQDNFPLVQDVTRQIAALHAQIAAAPAREGVAARSGRNPLYEDINSQRIALERDLRGLEARRAELTANHESLQARLDELNGLSRQWRDLLRSRDVLAETYRTFSLNSEEAVLGDALERANAANIRVVQPPAPPPTGRSLRIILAVGGLLVGLITAGTVLAVLNAMRQVFVSVHDLERALDLPVLAAIPRGGTNAQRRVAK